MRFIAWLLLCATVWAQSIELYVRNQPFEGPVRPIGTELYAPLDDLLRALGCPWELQGGVVLIRSQGQGPNPRLLEEANLVYEGRPIQVTQGVYNGRLFVSIGELARAVKSEFRVNRSLGTADLYAPAAVATASDRPMLAAGQSGSPLEVVKVAYALTPDPHQPEVDLLRGYAVVRNTGRARVEGVSFKVEVVDGAGNVLGRFSESYPRLGPGESLTFQFPIWPSRVKDARPRVEVWHLK